MARAVGLRNYFGSAVPPGRKGLHPDVVLVGYRGLGRHHFVDVSITEPATVARTQGAGRAAVEAGWAANDRATKNITNTRRRARALIVPLGTLSLSATGRAAMASWDSCVW